MKAKKCSINPLKMEKLPWLTVWLAIAILFCARAVQASVGANTPFTSIEAESGRLGGGATIVSLTSPPTTEFSSPQLEASGHAYVHLGGTGQYVEFTNNTGQSISTLNIRYSIPDSSGGGGISNTIDLYVGGTYRGQIYVNSYQTWVYETSSDYNGMSQSPSAGNPHVFWDEVAFFVPGGVIPAGTNFVLQMDSRNTAAYYNIDVVDLQTPPAALSQPANSLSITTYGAESNTPSFDNSSAIQNCINAAESGGKSVWIPPGTFYINPSSAFQVSGITIQGAGPWYSEIFSVSTSWANGFIFNATSTSFENFCIDANGPDSTPGQDAFTAYGNNWMINNVWARHLMLTWGTGDNITVENSRVNNSWGDGININNDNGTACTGVTITNNFVRGCGDDSIAINSSDASAPQMANCAVVNNTTVASWWADQMAVYGGNNILISNNLLCDCVKDNGIHIDTYSNGSSLDNITVEGNTVLRGGSYGYGDYQPALKLLGGQAETNVMVSGNNIVDSMFESVEIGNVDNLVFQDNLIESPGTDGIQIDSGTAGSANFIDNIVLDEPSGQSMYVDSSGSFSVAAVNNSWQSSVDIVPITSGALYQLVCADSGMALDNAGSTAAGTAVTQWTVDSNNSNQEWEAVSVGGGYYNLVCQTSDMNLDNGGSTTAGTDVTQWTINSGNINQYWEFVDVGGGYYNMVCEKSGMNLDNGGSITAGTDVTQYTIGKGNLNQYWNLQVIPQSGHYYHLICAKSGMALYNGGSTTAGTDVTQSTDTAGNNDQLWEVVSVGGGYYNLVCVDSGMALDNGGSTTAGTDVTQYTVNSGNINQYWKFAPVGNGYYNLVCEKSGMNLDNGGSTTSGTDVTQYTSGSGNLNQWWRFEFVR